MTVDIETTNAIPVTGSGPDGPATPPGRRRRIPGEEGIWVFILGDMVAFALFFGVFVHERASQVEVFDRSRENLAVTFGAVNTLLLLTASLFVVLALRAVRAQGVGSHAPRWIAAAGACGLVFAVNKFVEWGSKIDAGHVPSENDFYMYFFIFTGVHFVHLVIGMIVLTYMWRVSRRPAIGAKEFRALESGASYWHLVDLLWVVLFALLYLMSGG